MKCHATTNSEKRKEKVKASVEDGIGRAGGLERKKNQKSEYTRTFKGMNVLSACDQLRVLLDILPAFLFRSLGAMEDGLFEANRMDIVCPAICITVISSLEQDIRPWVWCK